MAQVVKKNDDLEKEFQYYESKVSKWWKITALFFVLWVLNVLLFHIFSPLFIVPIFGGLIVGVVICGQAYRKGETLRSGMSGEWSTSKLISDNLPDDYYGFQNVKVTYGGKTSEMDMVVVGKTGVYIIETKNLNGTIEGRYNEQQWIQHKIGQKGTPYTRKFYNPVKQVGTHVYRLANYLRQNGINVYVNAIVYFSNPETDVYISGEETKTPVFVEANREGEKIGHYITEREKILSEKKIKDICALLNN